MGGLDPDGPVSIVLGGGAAHGAETDLEVQYMSSPKLVLAL